MFPRGAAASSCAACDEPALPATSTDNLLLTGSRCAHKICRRCLDNYEAQCQALIGAPAHKRKKESVSRAAIDKLLSEGGNSLKTGRTARDAIRRVTPEAEVPNSDGASADAQLELVDKNAVELRNRSCPVCNVPQITSDWTFVEEEEALFERERVIREKVCSVYNGTRGKFANTPAYNDYLEEREQIVYDLAFGNDDARKKQLQEELKAWEAENQRQIVECQQKIEAEERERVKSIVARESTFYELVKQDVAPGFRRTVNRSALSHPLQKRYPELFQTEATNVGDDAEVASMYQLGSGKPQLMQTGLDYNKLPRRSPTDKVAMLRACGMFKQQLALRVLEEFWGGFEVVSA